MQHDNAERSGCFSLASREFVGWQNNDILIRIGLSRAERVALTERSRTSGTDEIVLYCQEQNLAALPL